MGIMSFGIFFLLTQEGIISNNVVMGPKPSVCTVAGKKYANPG
jgi:hypothetical protein